MSEAEALQSAAETAAVAIVGTGLTASALALALQRGGVDVVVVEPAAKAAATGGEDRRPIALGEGSRRILETLGVWPALAARAAPIERIIVSEQGAFAKTRVRAADAGVAALGQVLEAGAIAEVLRAALAGAALRRVPAERLLALRPAPGALGLVLDGPQGQRQVQARLLVGADGGGSRLRDLAGIGVRRREYDQVALTARVRPQYGAAGTAFERFTRDGPLALLPLPGGDCGVVWCTSARRADALWALDATGFGAALTEAFGEQLGAFRDIGPRARFDLQGLQARSLGSGRLLLVGNAANQLHPVAGQGLNLGLRDVAIVAELVVAACQGGADPGDAALLAHYQRARRADQARVVAATDALVRVFSNRLPPLALLRRAGLLALAAMAPARHGLARQAMGLALPHARLLRGLQP